MGALMDLIPFKRSEFTEKTVQAEFVKRFGEVYAKMTGQDFCALKKHFIIVARLEKKFGLDAVLEKAAILAVHCQRCDVWFTKNDGPRAFTIETLATHWNRLLPIKMNEERDDFWKAMKEEEASDARIGQSIK